MRENKTLHTALTCVLIFSLFRIVFPANTPAIAAPTAVTATNETLLVDTTLDSNQPGYQVCSPAANDCSLRGAISRGNKANQTDYNSVTTILLPPGTYRLTLAGAREFNNETGDLDITGKTILRGLGNVEDTIIDAAGLDRVFDITLQSTTTISGIKITGGRAPGSDATSLTAEDGGCIFSDAPLTLINSRVTDCKCGDGTITSGGQGGGIYAIKPLTLIHTSVDQNSSGTSALSSNHGSGGGIRTDATLTLQDSQVLDNHTFKDGGGIMVVGSAVVIENSRIAGNTAQCSAGGVFLFGIPDATIRGSTIENNHALTTNNVACGNGGGGLYINASSVTLENNFVAGNRICSLTTPCIEGQPAGPGIYASNSTLNLKNNTLASNSGGDGAGLFFTGFVTANMQNSLIAGQAIGIKTSGTTITLDHTFWPTGGMANTKNTEFGYQTVSSVLSDFSGNPDFVNSTGGNYHIGPASEARGKGIDVGLNTDIDHQPRPNNSVFDIGADQYWGCTGINSVNINGPQSGSTGTALAFTAGTNPAQPTPHLGYLWTPEPASGQGQASAIYNFPAPGAYTIRVSVTNCGGTKTASQVVSASGNKVYLPVTVK